MKFQLEAEQFCNQLTGDIISGRTESACHDQDIGPRKCLQQGIPDDRTIRHRRLTGNPESEGKELLAKPGEMQITHLAEKQFTPGIE